MPNETEVTLSSRDDDVENGGVRDEKKEVDEDYDHVVDLDSRSLGEEMQAKIQEVVFKTFTTLRQHSKLHLEELPSEPISSISLGQKLGQGGFSTVYQVKNNPHWACKFLSDSTLEDEQRLPTAVADIIREAHLLARLDHPNIITLYGVGSLENMAQYFILIEKIQTPLSAKIDEWTVATEENCQLAYRIGYAQQVASALTYLHEKNIVYRDLKIENLGINDKGQVIVYDFGLAKELKGESTNGRYKLTGNTGSWTHMAPEVAKGWKYNLKVDVYGFGILLWEILSARYAFDDVNEANFMTVIVERGTRPPIVREWPEELETLIRDCWHWNANHRPDMVDANKRLDEITETVQAEAHRSKGGFLSNIFHGIGAGT